MEQKPRLLTPEEDYRFKLVEAVAFEGTIDYEEEKRKSRSSPSADENCRKIGVFSEDEAVLYGCLLYNKYRCYFDGKEMLLGGVGGVATLPQYRRNGVIRTCMKFALRDMYEQGYAFSFLYPFSMQYYRKFGYEASKEINMWTLPMAELPERDMEGSVVQIFPGDSLEPLLRVYEKFYEGYNFSSVREKYSALMEKEDMLKQRRYVFLYRDAAFKPRGFFIFHKNRGTDGVIMDCEHKFEAPNDFLFLDAKAFAEMLSFIKAAFGSRYDKLVFSTPANISLSFLLGENIEAGCERFHGGMSRVVDVKKALEMCRCKGSGQFYIGIKDAMLPENDGIWSICFSKGQDNQVEKVGADTEEKADILLPINEFSALICGDQSAEDIRWMPNVVVYGKEDELGKIFYHKKCYIPELF